ncbi:MAG: Plug protein [Ignavibacteria bacterium]|nr:Plug protein [Ignavibacteria bacterium]
MKYIFRLLIFIICLQHALALDGADAGSINGFVKDKETGETIIGATVTLKDTKLGSYTNKSGFFTILNIPDGTYQVKISSLGYNKVEEKIKIKAGESIRKTFELKQSSIKMKGISVEAEREEERRELIISRVDIPVAQLKELRVGGESDVYRSLQFLPGILTSSQISSGLFVRGGSPDQNLVLLDGSAIYNPTHLFGFISTFNTDAVKDVELIKGGFPSEYGGRLSAVLNITQKEGNRNNFEGLASLGAISSRINLEGPLLNGSFYIGGRRTYLELVKMLIPDDPTTPLPNFNFYDVNAKITQQLSDNDKLSVSGFLSSDALNYSSFGLNMEMFMGNKMGALNWTHIFSDNLFMNFIFSGSEYVNGLKGDQSGYGFNIENKITDFTNKASFEWFTSEDLTCKFGYELSKFIFYYKQDFSGSTDSLSLKPPFEFPDYNGSIFGQGNYSIDDLLNFQVGLRLNYAWLRNIWTIDPRYAVRWKFHPSMAIKAAYGMFRQNLKLAAQQDFSFFDTWLPTDSSVNQSRSEHFILSLETVPYTDFELNIDGYIKKMYNISELNTTALQTSQSNNRVADVFYIGNAISYGAEIFLQKKSGRLTGWIGYALGYIYSRFDSINYGNEFRPKYDRRHDFKVVSQYQLNDDISLGGSFTFQSGQSYTGATSRFQDIMYGQTNGRGKIIPSDRFGLRLPASHQLNLNISYSFSMFGLPSKAILDIYNVYNRRDIWFRYYNTRENKTVVEDVRLLPIIPSISLEVKFL